MVVMTTSNSLTRTPGQPRHKGDPLRLEIRADSRQAYSDLRSEYQSNLVAPLDDMWAAFADQAQPHALLIGQELAGCCSIDEAGELHHFFVRSEFEEGAEELFT
jgi:hypothetical protein